MVCLGGLILRFEVERLHLYFKHVLGRLHR